MAKDGSDMGFNEAEMRRAEKANQELMKQLQRELKAAQEAAKAGKR